MATSARLDELKKKFDENPRRYFAPLANEYRKQGDVAQAVALCRTHLPNQPGHISGHVVLAQALYESHELAESRQSFEAAVDLDPENLIALRYLGDIAREQGAPTVAQAWYQRVLDADPRNDEIAQLLREVEGEALATRAELAARPTPPTMQSIPEEAPPADATEVGPGEEELHEAHPAMSVELPWQTSAADAVPAWDTAAHPEDAAASSSGSQTHLDTWANDDPFFSPPSLGDLEAVAEPGIDDWFHHEPPASAGDPALSAGDQARHPDESAEANIAQEWADIVETADDERAEEPVAPAAAQTTEESFPSWVAGPAEEAAPSWEMALSPEQLGPVPPEEKSAELSGDDESSYDVNPLVGHTPAFNQVIQETPAPFVTETMAELYIQQGFTDEALEIYRHLLARSPGDESLERRIAALEVRSESGVTDGPAGGSGVSHRESVRTFFARFALRVPRQSDAAAPPDASLADGASGATFGGAATRDEALTEPDQSPASLSEVFAARQVSNGDAAAAATLASAFGLASESDHTHDDAQELSLGRLFRDVEGRSAGAVTSAGYASDETPDSAPDAQGTDVESHADIEQFTAWLEGLKKK